MRCTATYRGGGPDLGAVPGEIYEVDLNTYGDGSSYLWMTICGMPGYVVPYETVGSLLKGWDFNEPDDARRRAAVSKRWMETYDPAYG